MKSEKKSRNKSMKFELVFENITYIYVYIYVYLFLYLQLYHLNLYLFLYLYLYIYIYIYICTCTCTCTYIYIYIFINGQTMNHIQRSRKEMRMPSDISVTVQGPRTEGSDTGEQQREFQAESCASRLQRESRMGGGHRSSGEI